MRGIYVATGKDEPTRFTFTIPLSRLNEISKYCKDKMGIADFIRMCIEEKMGSLKMIKKSPDITDIFIKTENMKWVHFYETDEDGTTYPSYSMSPSFFESFFNKCCKVHKSLFKVTKGKMGFKKIE